MDSLTPILINWICGTVVASYDRAKIVAILVGDGSARIREGMAFSLGAMPFEEHCVDRASAFDIGDECSVTTCSAEDLVVHKAFTDACDKDWLDVQAVTTYPRAASAVTYRSAIASSVTAIATPLRFMEQHYQAV